MPIFGVCSFKITQQKRRRNASKSESNRLAVRSHITFDDYAPCVVGIGHLRKHLTYDCVHFVRVMHWTIVTIWYRSLLRATFSMPLYYQPCSGLLLWMFVDGISVVGFSSLSITGLRACVLRMSLQRLHNADICVLLFFILRRHLYAAVGLRQCPYTCTCLQSDARDTVLSALVFLLYFHAMVFKCICHCFVKYRVVSFVDATRLYFVFVVSRQCVMASFIVAIQNQKICNKAHNKRGNSEHVRWGVCK